jgi:hypothetical protein
MVDLEVVGVLNWAIGPIIVIVAVDVITVVTGDGRVSCGVGITRGVELSIESTMGSVRDTVRVMYAQPTAIATRGTRFVYPIKLGLGVIPRFRVANILVVIVLYRTIAGEGPVPAMITTAVGE